MLRMEDGWMKGTTLHSATGGVLFNDLDKGKYEGAHFINEGNDLPDDDCMKEVAVLIGRSPRATNSQQYFP